MIIHQHIPKRKKRKANAKTRALKSDWEELLKKYDVKPETNKMPVFVERTYCPPVVLRRDSFRDVPSVDTGIGDTAKKEAPVYTGDAMIGISVLHKSNGIPVFRQEDAIDISKMRR